MYSGGKKKQNNKKRQVYNRSSFWGLAFFSSSPQLTQNRETRFTTMQKRETWINCRKDLWKGFFYLYFFSLCYIPPLVDLIWSRITFLRLFHYGVIHESICKQDGRNERDTSPSQVNGRATHPVVCQLVYMNQNFTFVVKSGFAISIWGKFLGNKTGWTLVQVICHRLKCHIIPVHLYDWWWARHAQTNKHVLACFSRSSSRRWLITRLKGQLCRKTGKTYIFYVQYM